MALTRGKRLGGAFLDLKELATDGPVLCIFQVVEFHDAEKASGFEGVNLPVTANVTVVDGPRKGEVHLSEKFIGAITSGLRGVRNPKRMADVLPPETTIGEEIVLRVKVLNPGKPNAGAVGDEPSNTEMAAAEAYYAEAGGKELWTKVPAPRAAEPAAAGAGNGNRPW